MSNYIVHIESRFESPPGATIAVIEDLRYSYRVLKQSKDSKEPYITWMIPENWDWVTFNYKTVDEAKEAARKYIQELSVEGEIT